LRCEKCKDGPACFKAECAPFFQEDRLRLWKGPRGDGWSNSLGDYMPDSRQKRKALEKEKGITFEGTTAQEKRLIEYREHVTHGGQTVSAKELLPAPKTEPKKLKETIMTHWRKKGIVLD
jgi:hypothetical protein